MKLRYTISEKAVMERDGAAFDLSRYQEGADYVVRKCFNSTKRMFRSDILDLCEDKPSLGDVIAELCEDKSDHVVLEAKIVRIYPNFKWGETDKGRVWVGLKGATMRRGQVIRVKDGALYLGKDKPSACLVKI